MTINRLIKENYERALSIQLNKLGPDHVDVALTYHNMGNLHIFVNLFIFFLYLFLLQAIYIVLQD